jgi:ParB-like chromosome segregation protein Spo0J
MNKLTISYRPLSGVAVNPRNARTHDKRQLKQIKDSIAAFRPSCRMSLTAHSGH